MQFKAVYALLRSFNNKLNLLIWKQFFSRVIVSLNKAMSKKKYCFKLNSLVEDAKACLQYNEYMFKMYRACTLVLYGHSPNILNDLIRLNTESIVLNRPRVPCRSRTQSGALTTPESTNQISSTPVKKISTLQGKYLTFENVEGETSHLETTSENNESTPVKTIPSLMESKKGPLENISPSNADKLVSPIISQNERKQQTTEKIMKNAKETKTFGDKSLPLIHKVIDKDIPINLISDTAVTLQTMVVNPKKAGRAGDNFSYPISQENERSDDTRQPDESVGMSSIFTVKQKENLIEYKEVSTSIVSSTDDGESTVPEGKAATSDNKKSRCPPERAAGIIQPSDCEICYVSPVKKTKISGDPVKKPEKYVSADDEVHLVPDTKINTNPNQGHNLPKPFERKRKSPSTRKDSVLFSRMPRFITSSETVEILIDVFKPVAGTVSPTNSPVSLLVYRFINPLSYEKIDRDKSPKDSRLSVKESKPGYSRNNSPSGKCATIGSPPISSNMNSPNRFQCPRDINPSARLSVNESKPGCSRDTSPSEKYGITSSPPISSNTNSPNKFQYPRDLRPYEKEGIIDSSPLSPHTNSSIRFQYQRDISPSAKEGTTGSPPYLSNTNSPIRLPYSRDISPSARLSVNESKPGNSRNISPTGKYATTDSPPFSSNTYSPNRFQYLKDISPSEKDRISISSPIKLNTNSPIRDNAIYSAKYPTYKRTGKNSTNCSSTSSSPVFENLDSRKHAHFLTELSSLTSKREVCMRRIYNSLIGLKRIIEHMITHINNIISIVQNISILNKDCFVVDHNEFISTFLNIRSKFTKKLVSLKSDVQSDLDFWTKCFQQLYKIKKTNKPLMSNTKPVVTIEDFLEYEESLKTKWDMLDDTITDVDSRRLHFLSTAEDFENCIILFVKFLIITGVLEPSVAI